MTTIGTIKDELAEKIKLKNVKIAFVEWLPFDRNQLSALNLKLDSMQRRRGHIVTALMDDAPDEIVFMNQGVSSKVVVEDFDLSEFVSFKASLSFPEKEEIAQKEELSVNINSWGRVIYGVELMEVEGSTDGWVSLDILSRIIVDLTMDSSEMIDTLLTEYQRNLLNLVFMGESGKRTKSLLIMAEEVSPHLANPEEFCDGEELQNELEELLGVLYQVEPLKKGFLFKGGLGLIAVSPKVQGYEHSLLERSFSLAIRLFLDDYSARIWHLWDESRLIEGDIGKAMLGDITSLANAQNWITRASSDAIMLNDILSYLRDSIGEFINELTKSDPHKRVDDPIIQELRKIQEDSRITTKRVNDTQKVIHGLETKMVALRDFSNTLAEKHMRRISDSMAQNTKSMTQMTQSNNRASDALSIIELILAGSVILDIVVMLLGEFSVPPWLTGLNAAWYGTTVVVLIALVLWVGVFAFLRLSKRRLERAAVKRQTGTYVIGRKGDIEKLEKFLATKDIQLRNIESEGESELVSVTWNPSEEKDKAAPNISSVVLYYDAMEKFVIQIDLESPDMKANLRDAFNYLTKQMEDADVFNYLGNED